MNYRQYVKTPIIPVKQTFYGTRDSLDHKSIAFFLATGFFPADATYYRSLKVMQPGSTYGISENGDTELVSRDFEWHYTPAAINLEEATEQFRDLLETVISTETKGKNPILPLSGGLDSRSMATALMRSKRNVTAYSYAFENGFNETRFGEAIAREAGFPFTALTIPAGYLWDKRLELGRLNDCYSEFTHARQMAVMDQVAGMGNQLLLGHWGDVLFDGSPVKSDVSGEELIMITRKKITREGGPELASLYWDHWGLEGSFDTWFNEMLESMYRPIRIDHGAARFRAFKSLYWAPRWTSINLAVFEQAGELLLPYYQNAMCRFICHIPEELLDGRQIQIAYIRKFSPELARIPWQGYEPCNLFNYKDFHKPRYLPYRAFRKLKGLTRGKPSVKRNWEIQFTGASNKRNLQQVIQHNLNDELLPDHIANQMLSLFYTKNSKRYSHPLSMLVTLATKIELEKQ